MTLALARFRPRERPSAGAGPVVDTPAGRVGAWRLLASMPAVRLVKCAFAVANFFTAPVLLVIPLYAKGVLAGSGATMATLEAALWFGLLAGAFSGGTIKVPTSRVTQFGAASVAVNALALALPGVLATFPVYAVTLALGGWCVGVVNVRFVAFFHEVVPPAVKGRFFAAMQGL
ncbi:MAG: hypothetical protein JOZ47_01320, partial [Kutzneria sp.]|nr:hypothetical protein [Kutzneria sp.]